MLNNDGDADDVLIINPLRSQDNRFSCLMTDDVDDQTEKLNVVLGFNDRYGGKHTVLSFQLEDSFSLLLQ